MFGFLNIYKPKGMTSHDVISSLRKKLGIKRIGHSGTLDPLAVGVLPVAIGKATRLIEYLSDEKKYIVNMDFGKVSDTYDTEGVVENYSNEITTKHDVENSLSSFIGDIEQIPPAYSAVHYKGKRLYELARNGVVPDDIPKRKVSVQSIKLLEFDESKQSCSLEISCSKGTYIRSIVHDLGQLLGVGAVMTDLERTKSSNFISDDSLYLDDADSSEKIKQFIINPLKILSFAEVEVTEEQVLKIKNGMPFSFSDALDGDELSLVYEGELLAIAFCKDGKLCPDKVFV